MKESKKEIVRILRCEELRCKAKGKRGQWPKGWTQLGKSRFGTKYDPDRISSWCPLHEKGTIKI